MKGRIRWSLLPFLCLFAVVLAACGSDEPGEPTPEDGSDGDTSLTDTDTSLPDADGDGGVGPDSEVDGETDGEVVNGSARRILYRLCEANADCPTAGTSCIGLSSNPILWSHKGGDGGEPQSLSATATDLFGAEVVPVGSGICSAVCTGTLDCSGPAGPDSIGTPAAPWTCQVVAKGAEPYTGIGTPVDVTEMEKGQTFAAICRPPSSVAQEAADQDLCADCSFGCNGECIDPLSGAAPTNGDGICSKSCSGDDDCAIGFECSSISYCIPVAGTCSDCYDPDSDEFGLGKCGDSSGKTPFDCDQSNGDVFFDIDGGRVRPPSSVEGLNGALYCSADEDSNCNGVADIEEMVGPAAEYANIFKQQHCTACNDVCDDSVIAGGVGGAANAAAECKCPEGNPDCAPSEAACVIGCAEGFLDCDGPNDCETAADELTSCGTCANDCTAVRDDGSANVDSVSCDEVIVEGASTFSCGLECEPGFADCNEDFSDGCEVDLSVGVDLGDGRVEHCGSCSDSTTSGLDPTFCGDLFNDDLEHVEAFVCSSGQCAVAECERFWGDCDGGTESGYRNGCEADLKRESNCGGCGIACDEFPRVFDADCVPQGSQNPICEVTTCDENFADCDEDVSNGCEVSEADGFTQVASCGGCANDCQTLLNDFDDPTAEAVCMWDSSDPETSTLDFCEVRCDPTAVTSCGGCGNDCTTLQTPGANLESVSCSFVEGVDDNNYMNNDPDLTFCEVKCEDNFASCPAADGDPRTCETDVTTMTDCGGCGQVCSTSGFNMVNDDNVQAVDCINIGANPATCECVDAPQADGEQICNGKRTICSEDIDEGCPTALRFSGVVATNETIADDFTSEIYSSDNGTLVFDPIKVASTLPGGDEANHPLSSVRPIFVKDSGEEWNLGGLEMRFQPYSLEGMIENSGDPVSLYRIVPEGASVSRTVRAYNFSPGDITGAQLNGDYRVETALSCDDNIDDNEVSVENGKQVLMPTGLIVEYFTDDRFGMTPDRVSGIGLECRYFTVTGNDDGQPGSYQFSTTGDVHDTRIVSLLSDSVPEEDIYSERISLSVRDEVFRRYRPISRIEIEQPFSVSGVYTNTNGTKDDITYTMAGVPPRFATSDNRVGQPEVEAFLWFGLISGFNIEAFEPSLQP